MFSKIISVFYLVFSESLFVISGMSLAEQSEGLNHSYKVLPGDVLEISVWDEPALQREVLILPDSTMSFPLVGSITTQGMTLSEIQVRLTKELSEFIPHADVSVAAKQLRGARVYVIGKVNRPGEIQLDRELTVMQALSVAGGLNTFADEDEIYVLRNENGVLESLAINYSALVSGRELESNLALHAGDVLVVN